MTPLRFTLAAVYVTGPDHAIPEVEGGRALCPADPTLIHGSTTLVDHITCTVCREQAANLVFAAVTCDEVSAILAASPQVQRARRPSGDRESEAATSVLAALDMDRPPAGASATRALIVARP
jgi:hypothetical protein